MTVTFSSNRRFPDATPALAQIGRAGLEQQIELTPDNFVQSDREARGTEFVSEDQLEPDGYAFRVLVVGVDSPVHRFVRMDLPKGRNYCCS